jgi:hypothetical protein
MGPHPVQSNLGILKGGGSITVQLTSCLTGLDQSFLQIKTKLVSWHTVNPKPVKWEVNDTVILPPLVFPGQTSQLQLMLCCLQLLFYLRSL